MNKTGEAEANLRKQSTKLRRASLSDLMSYINVFCQAEQTHWTDANMYNS